MDRRGVLKLGALLTTFSGLPILAKAQEALGQKGKSLVVWFNHGVHSAALPDGSWNLWVRPDPRDQDVRFVRLELQVAEDKEFFKIISRQPHIARKEAHYIVRVNYTTKSEKDELYYRFIALDTRHPRRPDEMMMSRIGILTPFSQS